MKTCILSSRAESPWGQDLCLHFFGLLHRTKWRSTMVGGQEGMITGHSIWRPGQFQCSSPPVKLSIGPQKALKSQSCHFLIFRLPLLPYRLLGGSNKIMSVKLFCEPRSASYWNVRSHQKRHLGNIWLIFSDKILSSPFSFTFSSFEGVILQDFTLYEVAKPLHVHLILCGRSPSAFHLIITLKFDWHLSKPTKKVTRYAMVTLIAEDLSRSMHEYPTGISEPFLCCCVSPLKLYPRQRLCIFLYSST